MIRLFHAVFLFALLGGLAVHAEENHYDRITFTVSAEKAVENDELTAVVKASESGQDTRLLADKVNQAISWALEQTKKEEAVESRTLGYTTNPVYRNGRVDGWQVQQSIRLKSMDSQALSRLLGVLQEKLQINRIAYDVSNEVRRTTEAELITEALARFKERAEQLQKNLQRSGYRIVKLNVHHQADFPQMAMAFNSSSSRRAMAEESVAPPSLDAGKQNLMVRVNVEIELSGN